MLPVDRKILRKMKYLSDLEGIMNRYLKEGRNWESHLENTRNFILDCLRSNANNTVTILGSGWLLDVPLTDLNDRCEKIVLVDIFHPPQIKHKMRKYPKVKLVTQDITGGTVNEVFTLVQEFRRSGIKRTIKEIAVPGFTSASDPGYVVSLNVLNQLDILIIDYLKKFNIYDENELLELRRRIQKAHLDSLPPDNSCLITDYEEKIFHHDRLEKTSPLIFIPLPRRGNQKTWEWNFDSSKSYYPERTTTFNVIALQI